MAKSTSAVVEHITFRDERLLSLANECISKLNEMVHSLAIFLSEHDLSQNFAFRERRDAEYYKLGCVVEMGETILPVTFELAQAMSQQIEHGSIESVAKLGIRLKLAELESSIRALERMLADKRVQQHYKSSS